MIVTNTGYLKLNDVLGLKEPFSIYATRKNTHILVKEASSLTICLCQPRYDRLPWKLIEGKTIITGTKVFDSTIDSLDSIDTSKWNNGNQIMSYEAYQF